jgi:hypothetical protein
MYSSSFVNLRGLFNKILYSLFIYRCDETSETDSQNYKQPFRVYISATVCSKSSQSTKFS